MVKLYAARTLPVNPPDAPFVLTKAQLWPALERKIRYATEFVPAMRECIVVKDEGCVVVRKTTLEQGDGKLRHMTEEVTCVGQQWIIFRQLEGSVTTNLVSHGLDETDQHMMLTYIFEWDFPDVEEGTMAFDNAQVKLGMMALMAVKESISAARRLVAAGEIK